MKLNIVPIINENDTVAVEEIKFGDNDNLSALVTLMVEADLLVVLSTVEGLYTCDPTTGEGEFIQEVSCVDQCLFDQCDMSGISALGRGGMRSKVEAIQKVVDSGIPAVIAKGGEEGTLLRILEGEIQQYGLKFGLDLARTLHSLEPRLGYVYYGNKRFFCKFRPTLSMPKGIEDVEEIRRHSMPEKMVEAFKRQIAVRKAEEKIELEGKEKPALSDLSPDELRVINALVEFGGVCRSKRRLQLKLGFGREKIVRLVDSLEAKGYVKTEKFGSSVIVKLSKKVPTAKPKR